MVHSCILALALSIFHFAGEATTELQWSPTAKRVNLMNLLRLDFGLDLWKGASLEAATIHMAKTNEAESILDDRQTFSNIQEENCLAAVATLGLWQEAGPARIFVGARNMNEDYFASPTTSFFTSSSPGIFPTISACYPIANYPVASFCTHVELTLPHDVIVRGSLYNGTGYNGWQRGDQPFAFRPKRDGVFGLVELSYDTEQTFLSLGTGIHSKPRSAAIWAYAERKLGDDLTLMVQYSEQTLSKDVATCKRYAEIGALYEFGDNQLGASFQHGKFIQHGEQTIEVSYAREIRQGLVVQPTVHFIHNTDNNLALCGRLTYAF